MKINLNQKKIVFNQLTPHLELYKSKFTSILSILMRISGFWLLALYFLLVFSNNTIFYTMYSYTLGYNFFLFTKFNPNSILLYFIIWVGFFFVYMGFIYHFLFGIRYLLSINIWMVELFQQNLELNSFKKSGFNFLILVILSFLILLLPEWDIFFK